MNNFVHIARHKQQVGVLIHLKSEQYYYHFDLNPIIKNSIKTSSQYCFVSFCSLVIGLI